ncbi:putative RNA polymerase II subunit B1 CTD phosphatase RPAP2 homolog [Triticum urartu]|nr:putative RNA polymerase II subunit B1 CTD phosphatase RPAP2 homolog [Triticum urartu]XP_048567208.1 putative RNA polymerase II subunit B1 CTD phosphatase RPAP2 homolog [Triticum urartu]XP_048567231.1 putative RNA polymerase II subunit B1 CTD phosphatase RPAP2 homolog [Triticum urartu]
MRNNLPSAVCFDPRLSPSPNLQTLSSPHHNPLPMATAAAARPAARTTVNVAGAVYRVQLALLDGAAASNEPLLHAAAAVLSRADYDDVVTERSIAEACGHPACTSPLPDPANPKAAPRFHISLREHRVYDLEEARKFCSERCLVASAAFAASLPPDRPFGIPPNRLDALAALFEGSGAGPGLGFRADGGKKEDEGRKVEIVEKEAPGPGEVTLQEWIGPSGAIEGYVPRHHPIQEGPMPQAKQGKASRAELSGSKNLNSGAAVPGEHSMAVSSSVEAQVGSEDIAKKIDDMVLHESTKTKEKEVDKALSKIFQQDEDTDMLLPCITDSIAKQLEHVVLEERNDKKKKKSTRASPRAYKSKPARKPAGSNRHEVGFTSTIIMGDPASAKMDQGPLGQYDFSSSILIDNQPSSSQYTVRDSMHTYTEQLHKEFGKAVDLEKNGTSDEKVSAALKSSLKAVGSKNRSQSVTWADDKSILEASKAYDIDSDAKNLSMEDIDSSLRRESAEACASALIEAAGAISSGTSEVEDAVSKAGIIILPDTLHQKQFENVHGKDTMEKVVSETDGDVVKWPTKTVLLDTDMFEVDDSWHDTPPEGFSLTLSAFATMWTTIFGWISRSSLAYVYMLDDSSVEEMLISNGREYPEKRVSKDSQSSEIKRALASCISNALPVLVSNMRMQIPVSKLETTLGYLIDTMSLVDALPALRSRQWQLLVLVLLDALSVHQLPALAPVISDSKLVQKILNSAQVSREEYDSMVDLILPFGRSAVTPMSS